MKKYVRSIVVLMLALSIFCSTSLFAFAVLANSSGLGIVDDTEYYIYNVLENNYTNVYDEYFIHTPSSYIANSATVNLTCVSNASTSTHWSNPCYKWKVDKQSDGTFLIENVSDKYLRVNNGDVNVYHNLGDDSFKFDIERYPVGDNKGKYTIKNGDKYLTRNGSDLTLSSGVTSGSFWTFMEVSKGTVYSMGYNDGDEFDTTSIPTDIVDWFGSMGYGYTSHVAGTSADTVLNSMKTSDIAILTGLGQAGAIITNPNGTSDSMIMADYELTQGYMQEYLHDLPNNALAGTRCVIYLSSHSGDEATGNDGSTYNLVDATYAKGAHYVLGFTCDVPVGLICNWFQYFYEAINDHQTIDAAVEYACVEADLYDGSASSPDFSEYIYFLGDGDQYLNF